MRDVIKLGIILLIITSVAAVVLGLANELTKDKIAMVEAEISEAARRDVLSMANTFEPVDEEIFQDIIRGNNSILEVYEGYSDENTLVGYAIKTSTPGYSGNVEVITGISLEGKITGIKVVSHQETPGLGANATKPAYQNQYTNKPTDQQIEVVKGVPSKENEIQALSGATVSSNAVTDGVNAARKIFNDTLAK